MTRTLMKRILHVAELLTTERLFIVILFTTSALSLFAYGSDVYLHLVTGRHIITSRGLPNADIFSFTNFGNRWVMHEWFYQIFLYFINNTFGIWGLKILGAGILTATLYTNKKNGELLGASSFAAWFTTLIFFLSWINFIGLRPHIITFLFFSLSLHLILRFRYQHQHKLLYFFPAIMVLWVNSHGGFLVGIILLGYTTVLTTIERRIQGIHQRLPWPLINSLALTIIASLVNPYGYEQLLFPFQLMDQWVMNYVIEWRPPDFGQFRSALFLAMVALFVLLLRQSSGTERWFRLLLTLPFILASLEAVRHLPIASFILSPFLATQISSLRKRPASALSVDCITSQQRASATATRLLRAELGPVEYILNWVVLFIFCTTFYFLSPALKQHATENFHQKFPVGATQYLIDNDLRGRMFTTLQYSDYILFTRYPVQQVFYDVRLEIYGKEIAQDYLRIINAQVGWQDLFEKYAFEFCVVDKSEAIYDALAASPSFILRYEDQYSAIFVTTAFAQN